MQRFHAPSFIATMGGLARAHSTLIVNDVLFEKRIVDSDRNLVSGALDEIKKSLDELPLSPVILSQFERLLHAVTRAEDRTELMVLIQEFRSNLIVELTPALFFMVPSIESELYLQSSPAFGEAVANRFPEAAEDIASAGRCLALNESTACVFHLMRVLELGLHALAENVGLDKDIVAHSNWKNVIDQIEKKVREIENASKSSQKIERLQSLSSVSVQFRYFKDAWRNHVSHAKVSYERDDALVIWNHAKIFMQGLVSVI